MAIRIAVIGVGHWHALEDAAYLTHLPKIPDIALVALHDPDARRAAEVADRLDPALARPQLFADYREMLAAVRPDFVLALGRHSVMAGVAHDLLDAGYPFLMEKPMGLDAGEVLGIAEKADRTGGFAAVPLFQRYLPFVTRAKEAIAGGLFGPLSHMSLVSLRPGSDRYVKWGAPWMLDPAVAGGGCLRNVGLHFLDMFLHVLGEDAAVVGAEISSRALGQPVEDYACVQLRSASGVLGTVAVGNTFPYQGPPARERGYVRAGAELTLSGRDALLSSRDGSLRLITADRQEVVSAQPEKVPALAILEETLERWQSGKPPPTDARDCWRAMALADQAYRLAHRIAANLPA
jgi:predicted dehydrogenase